MVALRLSKNLIKQLESFLDAALQQNDLRLYRIVESLALLKVSEVFMHKTLFLGLT